MNTPRALRFSLAVALAALPALPARSHSPTAHVEALRHWSYPQYTRVVIQLDHPIHTDVVHLPSNSRAGKPERLYLDLPGVRVGHRYDEPIPVRDGLLRRIRLAQHDAHTARLVVDLQRYDRHRLFTLQGPDRIVLDVYGEPESRPDVVSTPNGEDHPADRLPFEMRQIHTVVVDPGHGGHDPGAIGVGGLREADVTLAVGLELRKRLIQRGFRVVMTRDRDRFVSLEERTALAEGVGADVFVSIHANASRRRAAHGIETFYLDASNERHALRVAARENDVPPSKLDALQRVLASFRVKEISPHSAALASLVQQQLLAGVRAAFGPTYDLGVRKGPFHVLFLNEAPSVLVELGFVTNPSDARRLRSRLFQRVAAERIARGLSAYRSRRATLLARRTP